MKNIKEQILSNIDLWYIYLNFHTVSLDDFSKTQLLQLLNYTQRLFIEQSIEIDMLVSINPQHDRQYFEMAHSNYKHSKSVKDSILKYLDDKNAKEVKPTNGVTPINEIDSEIIYKTEHQKSKERFNMCRIEAEKYTDWRERINYWLMEKADWELNIQFSTLSASGQTEFTTGIKNRELFFDGMVTTEIKLIKALNENTGDEVILSPKQPETKTNRLKVNQIALIHYYEGIQITRENAREIAAKHRYTAKTSGEGLFQDYTYYSSTANRKGKPNNCTAKTLKNKIELFESVVNHLSENNKQKVIDEIKILKTIFENEYP